MLLLVRRFFGGTPTVGAAASRRSLMSSVKASATHHHSSMLPRDTFTATITSIRELSPTVRGLDLHLEEDSDETRPPFTFKAGQWVDFFVPGLERCGGFSMVSCPEELPVLRLAIKRADQAPPARWVHHDAKVGDRVGVKTGGGFFLELVDEAAWLDGRQLVLVAGGVGVNPMATQLTWPGVLVHDDDRLSMLLHVDRWLSSRPAPEGKGGASTSCFRVVFVYSTTTAEELLFRQEIEDVAFRHPNHVHVTLVCTRDATWPGRRERINGLLLRQLVMPGSEARTTVLVCGPPDMIETVRKGCCSSHDGDSIKGGLDLRPEQLVFEKWW